MNLIDLLGIIEPNIKIKLFIDDKKNSILYSSPISSALIEKYYYNIIKIYTQNNKLILKISSTNNQNKTLNNYNEITLQDILSLIDNLNIVKIFKNNIYIDKYENYLNHTINNINIINNHICLYF